MKKTTIKINKSDDGLKKWKDEDKHDDDDGVRCLGCLCRCGVKASSRACVMKGDKFASGCWGAALKPGGCLRNSINCANRIPKHPVCENGVLCLMCRKRAYANSAVGDKLHLARLLEWATPFTRATPLNELISVVFVNCGDEISQFVGKAAGAMKQYVRLELDMKPVLSSQCSCSRSNRHRGCEAGFVAECEVNNCLAQVSRGTHDPFWRGGVAVRRGSVELDTNPISSDICTCDLSFGGLKAERLHDSTCENYYRRPFGRYFQKRVMHKRKKKCAKTCLRGGRLTQRLTQDGNCRKKVMRSLWQVAVPCRRVGRRRISQPRCNQRRQITPKWERRQKKRYASLRCGSWVPKLKAISVATTDDTSNAFPHAVRSADKIQANSKKGNASLGCQLIRRKVNASVSTRDEDTRALPHTTRLADKIQARPTKHNASLRCRLLRRRVYANVATTDEDTHALPYAVRSADKIQARPTKHNARLGCRLLRLQTKLGASSNKNSDARVDVPAAKCSCSDRITEDNCNQTAACQPSLCKEYRFVGGGLAPASTSPSQPTDSNSVSLPVCILCLRNAPDYVPIGFQTTYTAKCSSCKRTNCNQCGSWEGAKFFCKWCFGEGITPSVEAMQSWKAAQQTCKTMRQQAETANWDDILFFVLQQTNTPAANCTSDLYFDPKEVVTAICLSHFHDGNFVEELLAQEWVNTWSGWAEIADDASNAVLEALAERFMRLAMEHTPSSQKTNAQRVRELHEQGLQLKRASAHGVNNCLIDALLLGLLDAGLVPGTMSLSQKQRRHLCAACRFFLYSEHGTPPRIYLDAHRDGPRVLDFFLRKKWPQDVAVRVWLYNRFDHLDNGLGADGALRWIDFECATGAAVTRYALHVYNQTDANERGYHFDPLLVRPRQCTKTVRRQAAGAAMTKQLQQT